MPGSEDKLILIVDDDEGVLSFMETVLRLEGHRVVSATGGRGALGLAERLGAHTLALLIADIMMPDMDGYTVAAHLTEKKPSLPVLYVSGFTEKELGARTHVQAAAPLLGKPFSADELRGVVRKILTGRRATGTL